MEVTKAAKGTMKYMGTAMNAVAGAGGEEVDDGVRIPVICFKLLDLTKVGGKRGGWLGRGWGVSSLWYSRGFRGLQLPFLRGHHECQPSNSSNVVLHP